MNPKVSVVVPNYNHVRYLARRLDSILSQTYRDFELILLDDASSDGSREMLEQYQSITDATLVVNDQNSGSPFVQWRRGLALARGDYVWIAESDDDADAQFLATLVQSLDDNPGVGLVYCRSLVVDEDDNVLHGEPDVSAYFETDPWQKSYIHGGKVELLTRLSIRNTIPNASAVLVRREALVSALAAMEEFRLAGDWWVWSHIAAQWNVAFVAKPLNRFRFHEATVRNSTTQALTCLEVARVLKFIFSNIESSRQERARSLRPLLLAWAQVVIRRDGGASFQWFLDVYSTLKCVDHWVGLKMIRYLVAVFVATSILSKARSG